jgi:chromate transporter
VPNSEPQPHGISFGEAARVWWRIALLSFGGPAGQIAVMHRILVDEKKWIGERRFLHALNFCMLLPGPEAQQLATYVGWLLHGVRGGLVAGALFILPGMVAIMALSWLYFVFGNVGPVEALFFGLKAAVLAIVLEAVRRIGSRALKNATLMTLAGAAFVAIFFFGVPFPLIVLVAALIGFFGGRSGSAAFSGGGGHGPAGGAAVEDADSALGEEVPDHAHPGWLRTGRIGALLLLLWLAPVLMLVLLLGPDNVFTDIATFFSTMAVVTFGGAYAVLAYVAQQAVETYGWLQPGEMLDGLGLAETTPGPLIMVTQFVGFLGAARLAGGMDPVLAGVLGGLLTTWVTFTPSFLWIFVGAPFSERLRHNRALSAALTAITAAVVGVILNLAIWFALHALFRDLREVDVGPIGFEAPVLASANLPALALTAAALVAMFRFRAGPLPVLAGCGLAGALFWLISAPIH